METAMDLIVIDMEDGIKMIIIKNIISKMLNLDGISDLFLINF